MKAAVYYETGPPDVFRYEDVPDPEPGEGETLMLVHGHISTAQAVNFVERLQRVGQDFAQQHLADQKLPPEQKGHYTLVVGMRSWLFGPFRDLKRTAPRPA